MEETSGCCGCCAGLTCCRDCAATPGQSCAARGSYCQHPGSGTCPAGQKCCRDCVVTPGQGCTYGSCTTPGIGECPFGQRCCKHCGSVGVCARAHVSECFSLCVCVCKCVGVQKVTSTLLDLLDSGARRKLRALIQVLQETCEFPLH